MTVSDLAAAMNRDLGIFFLSVVYATLFIYLLCVYILLITDHVFEVMLYVDKTDQYSESHSQITSIQIIQDIVKKSGLRCRFVPPPESKNHIKRFFVKI